MRVIYTFTAFLCSILFTSISYGQYCSTSNTFGDYRSVGGVVTTGGITNINNGPATNLSGVNGVGQPSYRDYTTHKVSQFAGNTINFQLWTTQYSQGGGSYSQSYAEYFYVWVDWNSDNDFTDPGEYMNINPASALPNVTPLLIAAASTGNGSITVPITATAGNKRMRIKANETSYSAILPGAPGLSTCGAIGNRGETEDYTLEVLPLCNIVPGSITTSGGSSACVSGNPLLTLSGAISGSNITYQWRSSNDGINWINVGTNSTTYAPGTLTTTTYYKVIINCTATINAKDSTPVFIYTINPSVTPSVTITSNAGSLTCSGTAVVFTATSVNGGSIPVYQWKKNGINVGTNSTIYTDNTLTATDVITVVMTSNATCALPATATSNALSINITPTIIPVVTVTAMGGNTICAGTPITFNTTATNGGTTPIYQWKINGSNVGANTPSYTSNALSNSDIITVEMTSNATCASPSVVTSPNLNMIVNPILTPAVAIEQKPYGSICEGTKVTFTALPVNEGTAPQYEWKKNGISVGTGLTYTNNNLKQGDKITCILTSNVNCASTNTASSTDVITIIPSIFPVASIAATPGTQLQQGQTVTFTATIADAGANPLIYWQKNSVNISNANVAIYTTNDLKAGDTITCIVLSSYPCAIPNLAKSNKMGISAATGIGTISSSGAGIKLYPNPNNGAFVVKGNFKTKSDIEIQVVDIVGKVVYHEVFTANNTEFSKSIDIQKTVSPGVYLLQVIMGNEKEVMRFVINK